MLCYDDFERSEECIDFTMIITSRNNAPISNYGVGFRCKSEYPWCIIESTEILDLVDKKILDDQKVPYEFSIFYEICRKRKNLQ
ncbi:Uncharacterized protein FWK35_00027691, partial [Aphis craccivora]